MRDFTTIPGLMRATWARSPEELEEMEFSLPSADGWWDARAALSEICEFTEFTYSADTKRHVLSAKFKSRKRDLVLEWIDAVWAIELGRKL